MKDRADLHVSAELCGSCGCQVVVVDLGAEGVELLCECARAEALV